MAHPLSGANPKTLAQVLARAGMPTKPLQGAAIALSVLGRQPFSLAEKHWMKEKLVAIEDMPPPVFILGHWRSGTTHLYNTMCKSGEWGFVPPVATGLPWDLFGIGETFKPLLERALPEHRYIDNIPVKPDSPQEDEIAVANMSPLSFYHGIYFPQAFSEFVNRGLFFDGCTPEEITDWQTQFKYLLQKLYLHQNERPLLIKNPVYTGRLKMLREMFPGARFVHIHRNPYEVFASMRNFYGKLLKQFALQGYDHVDIDETILQVYERMMARLEEDSSGLSDSEFIELPYAELDTDPVTFIEKIYSGLALPGFERAVPYFNDYLASVKTFQKNKFDYSDEAARLVEGRLGGWLEKWHYQRPGL